MRAAAVVIACFCMATPCRPAFATFEDDSRYTKLSEVLGPATPTGAGVKISHVEAHGGDPIDPNTLLPLDGQWNFIADPNSVHFLNPDKNFNVVVPPPTTGADISTHATLTTGQFLYGNTNSIASGIIDVDALFVDHWLQDGLLRFAQPLAPRVAPPGGETLPLARLGNHSWIGTTQDSMFNLELLQRADYLIDKDNAIQVVGVGNTRGSPQQPLMSGAFNVISAAGISGNHAIGTAATAGPLYQTGRTRPDLVAPTNSSTSHNTARISSAVALLIETGRDGGLTLSNGTVDTRDANPGGSANIESIFHAQTAEVIRAALMASANRQAVTDDDNNGFNDDYVVNTTNGLNGHYGAGQLDIFDAHQIVTGGEHDSREEGDLTDIGPNGFDYDASFTNSDVATYHFTTSKESQFTASLVWNVDIDIADVVWVGGSANPNLTSAATLHDLDLFLYDRFDSSLVTSSTSTIENTEHLFLTDLAPVDYRLEVLPKAGQSFNWDYGVGWKVFVPEPTALVWLVGGGLLWVGRRR